MKLATTLRTLAPDAALELVDEGAAFVDLRAPSDYLDVHIPGSLDLYFERGPGMATRARDCIPLEQRLIILDLDFGDLENAAAALRGKGFEVVGKIDDGINAWSAKRGTNPASTEVITGARPPDGTVLDVVDPGAPTFDDVTRIPVELLWGRAAELAGSGRVVVVSGIGLRAALAVGILERAGIDDVAVWRPR